jgi:hypothetical protein
MGASRRRLEIDRVLGFDDFPLGVGKLNMRFFAYRPSRHAWDVGR